MLGYKTHSLRRGLRGPPCSLFMPCSSVKRAGVRRLPHAYLTHHSCYLRNQKVLSRACHSVGPPAQLAGPDLSGSLDPACHQSTSSSPGARQPWHWARLFPSPPPGSALGAWLHPSSGSQALCSSQLCGGWASTVEGLSWPCDSLEALPEPSSLFPGSAVKPSTLEGFLK